MARKILIIEDDWRNMKLVRDLLRHSGYETLEATNGAEGVEMAKASLPSLVLTDIQMPVMDGLEVTRAIKADPVTCNIPVVALTALAMSGDEQRIRAAGCDGYISKPIRIQDFLQKVRQYLVCDR